MIFRFISLFLPHYCCSCGAIGSILCESCFNNIVRAHEHLCLSCGQKLNQNLCRCRREFDHGYFVGWHEDALESLISVTKFSSVRDGCRYQALLMDAILPQLPADCVVVPVPTNTRHQRQRGLDHTYKIAFALARMRSLSLSRSVVRVKNHTQHGATRRQRLHQAEQSYAVYRKLDPKRSYIIIDDVYTTGATVNAISKLLLDAGIKKSKIWVVVTAKQR